MSADAYRTEEHWGESQAGEHATNQRLREPLGGANERLHHACGFPLWAHVGNRCPDLVRDAAGYPMARKDDAA